MSEAFTAFWVEQRDLLRAENERLRTQIECVERDPAHENCRNAEAQLIRQREVAEAENERLKADLRELSLKAESCMTCELGRENKRLRAQLAEAHDEVCENGHTTHEDCTEACACVGSGKSRMERLQDEIERLRRGWDGAFSRAIELQDENARLTEELSATIGLGNEARATLTTVRQENAQLKVVVADLTELYESCKGDKAGMLRELKSSRADLAEAQAIADRRIEPEERDQWKAEADKWRGLYETTPVITLRKLRKAEAWDRLKARVAEKWADQDVVTLESLAAFMAELEGGDE